MAFVPPLVSWIRKQSQFSTDQIPASGDRRWNLLRMRLKSSERTLKFSNNQSRDGGVEDEGFIFAVKQKRIVKQPSGKILTMINNNRSASWAKVVARMWQKQTTSSTKLTVGFEKAELKVRVFDQFQVFKVARWAVGQNVDGRWLKKLVDFGIFPENAETFGDFSVQVCQIENQLDLLQVTRAAGVSEAFVHGALHALQDFKFSRQIVVGPNVRRRSIGWNQLKRWMVLRHLGNKDRGDRR